MNGRKETGEFQVINVNTCHCRRWSLISPSHLSVGWIYDLIPKNKEYRNGRKISFKVEKSGDHICKSH